MILSPHFFKIIILLLMCFTNLYLYLIFFEYKTLCELINFISNTVQMLPKK